MGLIVMLSGAVAASRIEDSVNHKGDKEALEQQR